MSENAIIDPKLTFNENSLALYGFASQKAQTRFLEFFTAQIRNPNTREAYFRVVNQFFHWCCDKGVQLESIEPIFIAGYVEVLGKKYSAPTVKQHLAAIRMLFDWLVTGQIIPSNPASAVKSPKHVVKKGKTPVLSPQEAKELINAIATDSLIGLRDRALIGIMLYSFARVGAVVNMKVEDYRKQGRRWFLRLHEKGGKYHEVPCHHKAQDYIDEYLEATGLKDQPKSPLFLTAKGKTGELTQNAMSRVDVYYMVKRRAKNAGLGAISCHTWRATGITVFMQNGDQRSVAAKIAAHESEDTTKLYDRNSDNVELAEVERIRL